MYPTEEQRQAFVRYAGACRWLWNEFLDMQKAEYSATGKFVFFHEMSKLLPIVKAEHVWLKDVPSNALVRVCKTLDRALKDSFKTDKGFPRFKARGKSRDSWYAIGQVVRIETRGGDPVGRIVLPKCGSVRFRAGRLPEGRILGGAVTRRADEWFVTLQCEVEVGDVVPVQPREKTIVGADLGLKELVVASDGVRVKAPRSLRNALKRLRRAQRSLSRKQKGSANRRKQALRVARLHATVADRRGDATHQATSLLVGRCSAAVIENLNVRGMARNGRLALSVSDADFGEFARQVRYKCEWAGKTCLVVDRFEPTTQTCSSCLLRKTGDEKLQLHHRIFRCAGCGLEMDRDLNAARNLRRIGIQTLLASRSDDIRIDVGQVMPERDEEAFSSPYACGDSSAGALASAGARHGSMKQEVADGAQERNL